MPAYLLSRYTIVIKKSPEPRSRAAAETLKNFTNERSAPSPFTQNSRKQVTGMLIPVLQITEKKDLHDHA